MTVDIHWVAKESLAFVEKYWAYYDRDWGRTRCHFCGHSDAGHGIEHDKNCKLIQLRLAWEGLQVYDALMSDTEEEEL